jgi:hypothetical protein
MVLGSDDDGLSTERIIGITSGSKGDTVSCCTKGKEESTEIAGVLQLDVTTVVSSEVICNENESIKDVSVVFIKLDESEEFLGGVFGGINFWVDGSLRKPAGTSSFN